MNCVLKGVFNMVLMYPVVFEPKEDGFLVYAPDLEINTFGKDLADALFMARDAISLWCVCQQDDFGLELPVPSDITQIKHNQGDIVTLVDVDLAAYRRMLDNRTVRKNLTLPSWLNEMAEKAQINFSQTLQKALKEELKIAE